MADTDADLLWTEEVAKLAGVTPRSITGYGTRAAARRAAGKATGADLPEPVDRVRREVPVSGTTGRTRVIVSPRWERAAIERWLAARPGSDWRRTA